MNVPTDISLQVGGSVAAALLVAAVVALIATRWSAPWPSRSVRWTCPRTTAAMPQPPHPRMAGLAIFFGFILSA